MPIKTVKCKLKVDVEQVMALSATLSTFAAACNAALAVALEQKVTRPFDLHKLCYHEIKDRFDLTANYAVRAIARVCASFGKRRPPTEFFPTSVDLDKDLVRYIPATEEISVSTVAGRQRIKLAIGNYQRHLLKGQKPKAGTLNYSRMSGKFYVNLVIETPDAEPTGSKPLGVDLGINRIATDSDGKIHSGKKINRLRTKREWTRRSLQAKGTKGAKRVLKRLSGRQARHMRDVNHVLSRRLVDKAKLGDRVIVLEDLSGIRQRCAHKGKRIRSMLGRWAFYQLRQFVAYKAAFAGVPVQFVSPAYTSKTCNACGQIGTRKKHRFSCSHCGRVADADVNAALNLAAMGQPVNLPEVA